MMTTNTSTLPTTNQLLIREALYLGRQQGIEARCGGTRTHAERHTQWERVCMKNRWDSTLGWGAVVAAYDDFINDGEVSAFATEVAAWKRMAGI